MPSFIAVLHPRYIILYGYHTDLNAWTTLIHYIRYS